MAYSFKIYIMRKISKISLKSQASVLSEEEMAKVLGKGQYRCCGGMGDKVKCLNVYAGSMDEALGGLSYLCQDIGYYGMGGCFMS